MKIKCLICGKNYHSLAHHLSLVHKITKMDYIKKYNLPKDYCFVSSEYSSKMSNSIKNDYWTDNRKEQRRETMIKQWENEYLRNKRTKGNQLKSLEAWRDEKYRDRVLDKRHTQWNITEEYNGILYRGKNEVRIAKLLDENKIEFQYEKLVIPYKDKKNILRTHITDFYLPEYNLIIEEKAEKRYIGVNEKLKQKAALDLGYEYIFIIAPKLKDEEILNMITGSLHRNM